MYNQQHLNYSTKEIELAYNIPLWYWRTIGRPDIFPFACLGILAIYTAAVYAATRNPKKTALAFFSKLGPALTIGVGHWLASYFFFGGFKVGSVTIVPDLLPSTCDAAASVLRSDSVWPCKKAKVLAWIAKICSGSDGWRHIFDEELVVVMWNAPRIYFNFQLLLFGVQHWWVWESKFDELDMNREIEEQRDNLEKFSSGKD